MTENKELRELQPLSKDAGEMMMDYTQKQKVNVFHSPIGLRIEVLIAKDGRRRSIRLTKDEVELLISKFQKQLYP